MSSDVDDASPTRFRDRTSVDQGGSKVAGGNVDRVLFNDLCEMVPLVQILMDKKAGSSFTRRGSMVYTKTPSKELLYRKPGEPKGRNIPQSIPRKNKRDTGDNDSVKDGGGGSQDGDGFAMYSSKTLAAEREELARLRDKVEDLQWKLVEKEEVLKSAEITKGEMTSVCAQNEELRHEAGEKDSVIRSIQLQLSDARIKLADKQAALEKTQWEVMMSMKKAEKLEEELELIQREVSLFMSIFQDLASNDSPACGREYDVAPYYSTDLTSADNFPSAEQEREMEEARLAYIAAVAVAKEKQDEESMAFAAQARLRLQSFIF
ncbi:hypothetical protein MLD38_026195 [Melastoma candidum]|uniref:Uncharacterized protein n=1 Tax=Melastoma candidum TaxID=119954 RepID=A0ACB9P2Z7_9MYRT|nr:hypothetical protein MLD38_026195 [Melastoma candidum]